MKQGKRAIYFILAAAMLLAACGSPAQDSTMPEAGVIVIDEKGVAIWAAVADAAQYECLFVDADYIQAAENYVTEPTIEVPEGMSVHVRAVLKNGEYGDWMVSDYYGEPTAATADDAAEPDDTLDYIDPNFDLKWTDVETYELLSSIDYASVTEQGDGSVYFEAAAPNGGVMRFIGRGVTVQEGAITFEPDGRISALDAIGRVCAVGVTVTDAGEGENWTSFIGGLTFTQDTSVPSDEELFFTPSLGSPAEQNIDAASERVSLMRYQPNYVAFGAMDDNTGSFTIAELLVYYDEATYNTGLRKLMLNYDQYGTYMAGDKYDETKEVYDSSEGIYDFYLLALPEVLNEYERFDPDPMVDDLPPILSFALTDIDDSRFVIGDLKDADGKVLDKQNDRLTSGATLEITLGDYTVDMPLPMIERSYGAQTLHELTPYNNAAAQGEVTALVVPVYWQDQPETATDEALDTLYAALGRVQDASGAETDHSAQRANRLSLSAYYDTASYGQHRVSSFVTDWYAAPWDYAEKETIQVLYDTEFTDALYEWVMDTYADMDWSRFDADGDGFFDSVILVNMGQSDSDTMAFGSYAYAQILSPGYTGEGAGTQRKPAIKNFISMNSAFLSDNTLIHEYAHGFGLIDYYDVTYSGIDAVGGFDMQSSSLGDWNAYSKYAVGWIEPTVVSDLAQGESIDITIGSLAATGDAVVIPAAGDDFDGPFNEYILLDLFTDEGVNTPDTVANGLGGAAGVRVSHVNAAMERRVLTGNDGVEYPIGTTHHTNVYNPSGTYMLEVIQAGGVNTFTDLDNLRTDLTADDLFKADDVFRAEDYSAFLSDGLMDSGREFGYRVEIVSIDQDASGDYSAHLRITRN